MKKISVLSILLLLGLAATSNAAEYSLHPSQIDLWDLEHQWAYKWEINWSVPSGEEIIGASLFFDNIRNWDNYDNDLWTNLLSSSLPSLAPIPGVTDVTRAWDNQLATNYFSGQGTALWHWADLGTTPLDLTYVFNESQIADLINYSADGDFALGIDPDCHYYNDGVYLIITTTTGHEIPEPATMLLLGAGLLGLFGLKRIRSVKK